MNVKLLGASGFVGTRLLRLLNANPEVYFLKNIDIQPSSEFRDITEIGDVRIQSDMEKYLVDSDVVVLLAAQHRDDVTPISLYYDTNVDGLKVVLNAMESNQCKRLVFFSSVSVYGLNKNKPDENSSKDPFNHYGKSKLEAELVLQEWYKTHADWNINIIRPTVIFGENNRGNVYNLLKQIADGKFLMVGDGTNKKSMAYVGNVASFAKYLIEEYQSGYNVFNYVDSPDMTMNELVQFVKQVLGKSESFLRIPYCLGILGGWCFDVMSKMISKKFSISSVRIKKFCATTEFDSTRVMECGFKPSYELKEALERTIKFEFGNNKD